MSLLVIYEVLGLFVNTLSADGKYSLCKRKDSQQPIQMQVSKKLRICCSISEISIKFKHFEKKDGLHNLNFAEIRSCKRRC